MKLDADTVSAARRAVDTMGLKSAATAIGMHKSVLSDIDNNKENVSREKENMVREWAGLPLLPSIETVEVPQGCRVAIVDVNAKAREVAKPSPKRKRKKRYSVPTDPIEAAEYLSLRTSVAWRLEVSDRLVKSTRCEENPEDTFEYGYE